MQSPVEPSRPDWRPTHIPKLSYRNSTANDGPSQDERPTGVDIKPRTESTSPQIASSETFSRRTTHKSSPMAFVPPRSPVAASPRPQKKKASLFGGLFVKEESSAALEQLSAQLIAQHGELSARAVPGVSSAKMPDFVPKVNSKWDGIPESIKQKEKQDKERDKSRLSKHTSSVSAKRTQSERSAEQQPRPSSSERKTSTSTLSSFDSRGGGAEKYRIPQSLTSSTSQPSLQMGNSSEHTSMRQRARPASEKSMSLRSPSGTSLPEITSFFPNDIPAPPPLPIRYLSNLSKSSEYSQSNYAISDSSRAPAASDLTTDIVPDHSSSPIATPQEGSPVTPLPVHSLDPKINTGPQSRHGAQDEVVLVSQGPHVLSPPARAKQKSTPAAEAFFAGEARPLELPDDALKNASDLPLRAWNGGNHARQNLEDRPDTSRARLGLRVSMVIGTDAAPWESGDSENQTSANPRLGHPGSPKGVLPKGLGRFSKEKAIKR